MLAATDVWTEKKSKVGEGSRDKESWGQTVVVASEGSVKDTGLGRLDHYYAEDAQEGNADSPDKDEGRWEGNGMKRERDQRRVTSSQ